MESHESNRESRPLRTETTGTRPQWRGALAAGGAAILLLLTFTGFDRGATTRSAAGIPDETSELAATLDQRTTGPAGARVEIAPPVPAALPAGLDGTRRERLAAELDAFYRQRGGNTAWTAEGRPAEAAGELIAVLRAADRHGLDPADYGAAELGARVEAAREAPPSDRELAALDADLTAAFLAFAADLCCGRLDRLPAAERWGRADELPDLAGRLERALAGDGDVAANVNAALDDLAPPYPEYASLAAALVRYRRIADYGGWPAVSPGPPPKPGDPADAERMVALAERLRAEGYLSLDQAAELYGGWTGDGAAGESTVRYEEPLVSAVRRFQERHGLLADAELGEATLRELNVPAAERAEQIAINLERWRFVPRDLGDRHLRVNVAGFRLSAHDGGREVLAMPVVVGRRSWATPLFADRIAYLEVNPYWHVPSSIARGEILPKAAADPSYLTRNAYQLVDRTTGETIDPVNADLAALGSQVRVRQRPGRSNALGQIKFIFPNRFNVYLHDTPEERAFERSGRALSHGCVRVERPVDLAEYVLARQPEWDGERVRAAIDSGRSQRIDLEQPLPVYLFYWTAFTGTGGELHFRPDVYGHDERVAESLAGVEAQRLAAREGSAGGDRRAEVDTRSDGANGAEEGGADDAIGAPPAERTESLEAATSGPDSRACRRARKARGGASARRGRCHR